ncbi:MAG: hypothetical protein ACRD3Q_09300 [Terriglobales bacterium]
MENLTFNKSAQFPFWKEGSGSINVDITGLDPTKPMPVGTGASNIAFGLAADPQPIKFGDMNELEVAFKGGLTASITPQWDKSNDPAVLKKYNLSDFFNAHHDEVLLIFDLAATASADLKGSFRYSALSASAELEAGVNNGYVYTRSFPANTTVPSLFEGFVAAMRLPGSYTAAPVPGEVSRYDFGGYLSLTASAGAGYEITGNKDVHLAALDIVEKYNFSAAGKLTLGAKLAGYFSVETRLSDLKPGWARVQVKRTKSNDLTFAADVNVGVTLENSGLPDSADDFLSALLGVKVKSWLDVIGKVAKYTDPEELKKELDSLSKDYLSKLINKAFDELSQAEFNDALALLKKIDDSYNTVEERAITLFDQYFDKVDVLKTVLTKMATMNSWEDLIPGIDNEAYQILSQLTGGDIVSWALGLISIPGPNGAPITVSSLGELKKRIAQVSDFLQSSAHEEIRKAIGLAKQSFGLDPLFQELSNIDTPDKLKAIANTKIDGLVERLVGSTVDDLVKNNTIGTALTTIHTALEKVGDFKTTWYAKFKDALSQTAALQLNYAYSRAAESDALIDVSLNVADPTGQALLHEAARGNFQNVLANYNSAVLCLHGGTLSDSLTTTNTLSFSIAGFHNGWHYVDVAKVITSAAQQIVTETGGAISVYTTIELDVDHDVKHGTEKAESELHTNFLLRFIGESTGVLKFDDNSQRYEVDRISQWSAGYDLAFSRSKMKLTELKNDLSVAADFDFTGASNAVGFMPQSKASDYGTVSIAYNVRYAEEAVQALFVNFITDDVIRTISRKVILGQALGVNGNIPTSLAWAMWTQAFHDYRSAAGAQFFATDVSFPADPSPFASFAAPPTVTLRKDFGELDRFQQLYAYENLLVSAFSALQTIIDTGTTVSPTVYEAKLADFGNALHGLNSYSPGIDTIYAIVDGLIARLVKQGILEVSFRKSTLTITSDCDGQKYTKMLIAASPAAPAAPAPPAAAGAAVRRK